MKLSLEKILKYGIYLSAFMPLIIFDQFLSPFHFGKIIVFRILVEVLLILYLVLVFRDKRFLPKFNRVFWIVTSFTIVFGLTTITSISPYQSFWGTLERMGGWFSFLHFWIFFVILISILRNKEDWFTLIKISVWVGLISTLYGFLQKTDWSFIIGSGGRARIFGTIGNTALFAGYELLNVFLGLVLIFKPNLSLRAKYLYGVIVILDLIAIASTAVRGSILAIFVALVIFVWLYPFSGATSKKIRRSLAAIIIVLIFGELLLIVNHNSGFVKNSSYLTRVSDVSPQTYTVNTRFWAWQAGIDGWNDSIKTVILGWGPENFNVPFSQHFNPKFYRGPGSETLFDRAHNMFIEILVTMGLLGFLAYVAIFVVLFLALKKLYKGQFSENKVYAAVLIPGLVAYIIHNSFIFDTSANFYVFFIIIGFIYWLNEGGSTAQDNKFPQQIQGRQKAESHRLFNQSISFSVIIIVVLFSGYSILKSDIQPALANYATTRALIASWAEDHNTAIKKFQEALSYGNILGAYEIRHRFAQYVLENYSKIKPPEARQKVVLFAVENVKQNLSFKEDYLPYLYISRSYIVLGKDNPKSPYNDLAVENSLRAIEISPKFVRSYYELAQAYLNKKDYPKAIEAFKTAAELNPEVGLSYGYWAAAEMANGNVDGGLALLIKAMAKGYSLSENDLGPLLGTYIKNNDFNGMARLYESLIKINPANPQYHASLAAAYAKLSRIDDAVAEARTAVRLDPSFAAEAKKFVENLGRQW